MSAPLKSSNIPGATDPGFIPTATPAGTNRLELIGYVSTSPFFNTALGVGALAQTTDRENTAIGYNALANFTHSVIGGEKVGEGENTAVGAVAGEQLTTGEQNVMIGAACMKVSTTSSFCTAVGQGALEHNTTGSFNHCLGTGALRENTTGSENIAIGSNSLLKNTTQTRNIAIGINCMREAKTTKSIGIGYKVLFLAESEEHVALGYEAGVALTNGVAETLIGAEAGKDLTTGSENAVLGKGALRKVTTGGENTALGARAGINATLNTSASIFIGYKAGPAEEKEVSNQLYIHNEASNTPLIFGNFFEKELKFNVTKLSLYGGVAVAQHAKITPAEETLASVRTKLNEVIEAIKGIGVCAP